ELMMPAVEAAAKRASIPVAIQLDHASSLESARRAINLGCNGITLSSANRHLPENIEVSKQITEMAHGCGVPVVGEVGHIGSNDEDASAHTMPVEARAYVERSGVDFLSVSIGTVQGRIKGKAKLDFPRLKQIHADVDLPLVLHGGSGLNEEQFRRLTSMGVAKINYFTRLSDIAAKTMRDQIKADKDGSFIDLKQGVKAAVAEEVERCLRLWGSAGRAAEVLTQCQPWAAVEQVIIYNVEAVSKQQARVMIEEGRHLLANIPGVREVFSGEAVKEDSKYKFCWLVRFTDKTVIESYRQHPDQIAFGHRLFHPFVTDQVKIDFQDSATFSNSHAMPSFAKSPVLMASG
ncbi:MAG: class II fructose-bisphosphate aldolase, partial [Gammaproteobacteria bacterium]|nr:class II fructose-bisphosphate aldolase [Gammaproteobacteria bacterium]